MIDPGEARYDEAVESLLRDLAAVLRRADPVPQSVVDDARAALRMLDNELAQLGDPVEPARSAEPTEVADSTEPTEVAELAGRSAVRGDQEVRLVSFEVGGVGLELEIIREGRMVRVVGQVVAPSARSVVVEHAAESTELQLDASGRFLLDGLPAGPLRVRCLTADGATVAGMWITV